MGNIPVKSLLNDESLSLNKYLIVNILEYLNIKEILQIIQFSKVYSKSFSVDLDTYRILTELIKFSKLYQLNILDDIYKFSTFIFSYQKFYQKIIEKVFIIYLEYISTVQNSKIIQIKSIDENIIKILTILIKKNFKFYLSIDTYPYLYYIELFNNKSISKNLIDLMTMIFIDNPNSILKLSLFGKQFQEIKLNKVIDNNSKSLRSILLDLVDFQSLDLKEEIMNVEEIQIYQDTHISSENAKVCNNLKMFPNLKKVIFEFYGNLLMGKEFHSLQNIEDINFFTKFSKLEEIVFSIFNTNGKSIQDENSLNKIKSIPSLKNYKIKSISTGVNYYKQDLQIFTLEKN